MKLRPLPPMLTQILHASLQVCDGTVYPVSGPCPHCGGTLSNYDTRTRRFCVLREDEADTPVEVLLKRAYCRSCGKLTVPEGPFYPGTRVGSPVIDLCRAFALTMPPGRVAGRLRQAGIIVDRWSVRDYLLGDFPAVPSIAAFGMLLPITVISLSNIAGTTPDSQKANGEDILLACMNPALYRRTDGMPGGSDHLE